MQSFTSLPPPAAVARFLSYVTIYIASLASQDATLASLLMVGIFFKTLWACVGVVGCICSLTQVGGGVVALCPRQSSRWHLQVLHILFQLVPVIHGCGYLFTRGLKILLQHLFWFGNYHPSSMSQLQGVWNRHARTSKTFPYYPKWIPLSHLRCLFPNSETTFVLNKKESQKPCQEPWWIIGSLESIRERNSELLVQCHCLE